MLLELALVEAVLFAPLLQIFALIRITFFSGGRVQVPLIGDRRQGLFCLFSREPEKCFTGNAEALILF